MMGDGGCDDDGSAGSSLRPPRPEIMVDFEADHQAEQKQNHRNLQITQKSDEILRCLSGSKVSSDARDEAEEVVDLWHLRSLALSPGGLLDSTLRKRAWPKLLGVDARVLGRANGTSTDEQQQQQQQQKIRLSSSTVAEIKRDVGRAAWDVEGHIRRLRRERQAAKDMERRRSTDMFQKNNKAVPRTRKANQNEKAFVPTLPPRPMDGAIVGTVSPAMSPALPSYYPSTSSSASRVRSSSSSSNGSVGGGSVASLSATVTSSPARNTTFDVSLSFHGSSSPVVAYSTFDGIDSPFPAVSKIVRNGKGARVMAQVDVPQAPRMPIRTKQEQDILLNILTTVLRTPPTDSSSCTNTKSTNTASVNDERLHYTSGLHSLASLLLINLESPSLTSLTLQKLSTHHLRDVVRPTLDELGACIRIAFLPLLHRCDPTLHRHLIRGDGNGGNGIGPDCPFAVGWIVGWFAHESTLGLEVASRLFDVFLCSHPLMPVYLSVAMLTHSINRDRILAAAAAASDGYGIGADGVVEVDALNQVLCRVPRDMVSLVLGNSDELFFGNDVSSGGGMVDEGRKVELMEVFEGIIDAAIGLMRNVPPTTLLRNAKSYSWGTLSTYVPTARSATSMQSLPSWAVAPTASTDWSLIQKAKAARDAQLSPMSDASTPTSSPLASKRFFLGSISSPKKNANMKHTTIVPTASSYQIAVDAAGLGGAATADVKSARIWKMVICLVGVTAAVSTGMVGLVPEEEVNNSATPHSSSVPGRRSAAWNEVEGKFESSTAKIISNPLTRRVPHSSPAPIRRCAVWNKAEGKFENAVSKATSSGTKKTLVASQPSNALVPTSSVYDAASPPTVSRVVSSVKVHAENAFVYGMSFVGESVGPIFKPTMAEESTIDFDAKQDSTVSVDHKFKNLMSGRLDRLGNVIEDALPSSYYY